MEGDINTDAAAEPIRLTESASDSVNMVNPGGKHPRTDGASSLFHNSDNNDVLPKNTGTAGQQRRKSGHQQHARNTASGNLTRQRRDSQQAGSSAKKPGAISPTTSSQNSNTTNGWIDPEEFELRRRLPNRLSTGPNDIYITRRTNFKAQITRCHTFLDRQTDLAIAGGGKAQDLWIHGLGAAVNRAINLALQVKRDYVGSVEMDMKTSTESLTDDVMPLLDDRESSVNVRNVSAIHIRLFRPLAPADDY